MAQWTPITPENLPKKGQMVLECLGDAWDISLVRSDWTTNDFYSDDIGKLWIIAPPEVKP